MSKHTQGPWGISSQSPTIIKQYDFLGETNVLLGSASGHPNSGFFPSDAEALANARLMAAAPELLAAAKHCKEMLLRYEINRINGDEIEDEALTILNTAISKATGSAT